MDAMIAAATGIMGVLAVVVVFVLAFAGIYVGHAILKKHFAKKELQAA